MKIKYKKLVLALGLVSFGISNAALNIHSNAVELAKTNENKENFSFVQKGLSPETTSVVKGFGKEMPLSFSLKMIVPSDWRVNLEAEAEELPVNWQGKVTWPYVLENMAKENDLDITINWERRIVDVVSREVKRQKIAAELEEKALAAQKHIDLLKNRYNNASKKINAELSLEDIYNNSNVKPLDNSLDTFISHIVDKKINSYTDLKFYLKPGRMLTENLKEWSHYVDWDLTWNAKSDYRITREVVIEGTFMEAIDQVLRLYQNAEKPLKANFYVKNSTLEIEEFDFENKNGE